MRNLILLAALLATSAFADVSVKVNRIEASVIDNAEESANEVADTKATAKPGDHNSTRSNRTRSNGDEAGTLKGSPKGSHRDAASGLPTGKRQHYLDPDSDDDGLEDRANDCDDDCDSDVGGTKAQDYNSSRSNRRGVRADTNGDTGKTTEQKVVVRGWDPEKKEANEKSTTKKVKIPALDGSSKEPSD